MLEDSGGGELPLLQSTRLETTGGWYILRGCLCEFGEWRTQGGEKSRYCVTRETLTTGG